MISCCSSIVRSLATLGDIRSKGPLTAAPTTPRRRRSKSLTACWRKRRLVAASPRARAAFKAARSLLKKVAVPVADVALGGATEMSGRLHCVTTDQSAKGGGFRIPHLSGDFLDGQACRLQQIPRGFNPDALHELDRGEAADPCNPPGERPRRQRDGLGELVHREVTRDIVPRPLFSAANTDLAPFFERYVTTPHSVVTAHLIDEAGQPTIAARDEILEFFKHRLAPDRPQA